ncbi:MAG: hypothetical protein OS112_05915 [Methanoregula sp.]|nr:MAG: hypothetical protein OS112_05915 [Methanoregula sp.]
MLVEEVFSGNALSDAIMVYFADCNFMEFFGESQRNVHLPPGVTLTILPVPDVPERSYGGTPSEGNPGPVILIKVVFPAVLIPSKIMVSPRLYPPDPRSVIVKIPSAAVTGRAIHITAQSRTIARKQVLFSNILIVQPLVIKNII